MSKNIRKWILIGLFALILILGIFSVIYSAINPDNDLMTYISGSATFVIALLTILYVYVTSGQLDVMSAQLNEMRVERQVQSQPLPWIKKVVLEIEKPRLFYTPPDNSHVVLSRCYVKVELINAGTSPAVCVDVSANIRIRKGEEDVNLSSTSLNIPALERGQGWPHRKNQKDWFLFTEEGDKLINSLLSGKVLEYPLITLKATYKNILGGCFVACYEYRIFPVLVEKDVSVESAENESVEEKIEVNGILTNWLSVVSTFKIKYRAELQELVQLKEKKSDKWDELFDKTKKRVAESVPEEDLVLDTELLPGSFYVNNIDEDEYRKLTKDIKYGLRMG